MNNFKRYQLDFDFEFISIVDETLINVNIIHKSFSTYITYIVDLDIEQEVKILSKLLNNTFRTIKIKSLIIEDECIPSGTDKPIGSKAAIDEN